MTNIMDRTTLARFLAGMALFLGVAFLTSTHANAAEQFVAGGIKATAATAQPAPVYSAVVDGKYSFTMLAPYFVFFEDPQVSGVVAQDDTNPLHACKACVWVVPFAKVPTSLKTAKVHLCKLQGEWSCGSGDLTKIVTDGARGWAVGSVTAEGVRFADVGVSPEALAKGVKTSLEGFTIVAVPDTGLRAWIAPHPAYSLKTAKGTAAHAWLIDLAAGKVKAPTGLGKAFAEVVKQ